MRLLNIKTGTLETVNINFENNDNNIKYLAISHRWLPNEINLSKIKLIAIEDKINIGEKLLENLINNVDDNIKENIKEYIKNQMVNTDWDNYMILKNFIEKNINLCKKIDNHYKLLKIFHCSFKNDYEYIWIDTLCIDKSSSSELSENIISMYNIYMYAKYVQVHLCKDYIIDDIKNMLNDEWFSRGWTLQEYLANKELIFYDNNNKIICTKKNIWEYTKNLYNKDIIEIPSYLFEEYERNQVPAATILNWILKRETTKPEDLIYSLMGILNTYIMPLYGEGSENAMKRLLKEYLLNNDDPSVFDIISENKNINDFKYMKNKNNLFFHYNILYNIDNYWIAGYFNFREINFIGNSLKIKTNIKRINTYKISKVQKITGIYKKWITLKKINKNYITGLNIYNINNTEINGIVICSDDIETYKKNKYKLCIIIFNNYTKILAYQNEPDYRFVRIGKYIDKIDLIDDFINYDYDNTNIETIYIY